MEHPISLVSGGSAQAVEVAAIVPAGPHPQVVIGHEHADHSGALGDDDLVRLWLSQRSRNTRAAYQSDTSRFLGHLRTLGRDLRSATLMDVQSYLDCIVGAPATKARRIASMKSLLSFAYKTGYTRFNVGRAILAPKLPNDLAERILSEELVIRMIAAAKPGRDQTLVRLLYVAGVRVSEAEGLHWRHIHQRGDGAQITVHGKGGKTRHILLTPTITKDLSALRGDAGDDDPVFRSRTGKPLRVRDIRNVIYKVARAAGITAAVSPHWLRHAHASHALDRGAPIHLVQQDLGHASVATTSRYLHARPDDGSANYLPA